MALNKMNHKYIKEKTQRVNEKESFTNNQTNNKQTSLSIEQVWIHDKQRNTE